MAFIQLSASNGSWNRLKRAWAQQCEAANEEFDQWAVGTFLVLDDLAAKPEASAGIFAVQRGDEAPDLICQVNCTPLPGHPEPVVRVRMVTVSPEIDFGHTPPAKYIETLADLFFGIVELSQQGKMAAGEFKLHLRSPEDFNFFRVASRHLSKLGPFESVAMHGAWLHVIKTTN